MRPVSCKRHLDFQAPFALTHVWPIRSFRVNSSFKPICPPAQSRVAYAKSETQTRKGFTLVELIVVIVILGILAAIAIPALTGYISKAEDEQYIMRARDVNIAVHAVIDEAWAKGEFNTEYKMSAFTGSMYHRPDSNTEVFFLWGLGDNIDERAAALLGENYADYLVPGGWLLDLCAASDSGATAATADGFYFALFPEAVTADDDNSPVILVTYRVSPIDPQTTYYDFSEGLYTGERSPYDANAGYEVYHLSLGDYI